MNKTFKIIITIVAVVLIGGALYVSSTRKSDEKLVTSTDMTNWKTYISRNYGFTLKYPEDWTVDEYTELAGGRIADAQSSATREANDKIQMGSEITPEIVIKYNEKRNIIVEAISDSVIAKEIVSTFKTDNNPVASDWKTYTDQAKGFEIQYPTDWGIGSVDLDGPVDLALHSIPQDSNVIIKLVKNKIDCVESQKSDMIKTICITAGNRTAEINTETGVPSKTELLDKIVSTFKFTGNNPVVSPIPTSKTDLYKSPLTLISPSGSQKYKIGDTVKIAWKVTGEMVPLEIDAALMDNCSMNYDGKCKLTYKAIAQKVDAKTLGYEWKIPSDTLPGQYRIQVTEDSLRGYGDTSDIITITNAEPTISVISPNGSEVFSKSTNTSINLAYYVKPSNTWPNASIFLVDSSNKEYPRTEIGRLTDGPGATNANNNIIISLDSIQPGQYKVKVCDPNDGLCDLSDTYLTITN